jgi:hypothetical protein
MSTLVRFFGGLCACASTLCIIGIVWSLFAMQTLGRGTAGRRHVIDDVCLHTRDSNRDWRKKDDNMLVAGNRTRDRISIEFRYLAGHLVNRFVPPLDAVLITSDMSASIG